MRRIQLKRLSGAAVAALLMTGCGNGGQEGSPSSAQSTVSTPTPGGERTLCGTTIEELDAGTCDAFLSSISQALPEPIRDSPDGTYRYARAWCDDQATPPPTAYTDAQVAIVQDAAIRFLCPDQQ